MTPEKSFLKPHQSVSEILEIFESKNIFGKKKGWVNKMCWVKKKVRVRREKNWVEKIVLGQTVLGSTNKMGKFFLGD